MKIQIKNRWSMAAQFECEIADDTPVYMQMRLAIKIARESDASLRDADLRGANLCGANLCGADLRGANLRGANLCDADLRGANLCGADLCDANLCGADLRGANLCGANLCGADLRGADLCDASLCGADLRGANLCGANLCGADLCGANLCGADLRDADLRGANLRGANLCDAKNADLPRAQTIILPEGSIIGWKKLMNGVIAKLRIPEDAKRSNASGRKCRAEYAEVLEVIGADFGVSQHDQKTRYAVGEIVRPDSFNENRWEECAPGIHFFITRIEAENY